MFQIFLALAAALTAVPLTSDSGGKAVAVRRGPDYSVSSKLICVTCFS